MVHTRRRGTAIIDTPNGILVVNEKGSRYMLPGGGARVHKSRENAAIRELLEETGLKAEDTLLVPLADHTMEVRKKV